jgi:hypothetical protein
VMDSEGAPRGRDGSCRAEVREAASGVQLLWRWRAGVSGT